MTTLQEIELAIEKLPRKELSELVQRLRHRFAEEWDRQIEQDLLAGKLDKLAERAVAEYRAGKTKPFPVNGK